MTDRDDALRRQLGWTGPEESDYEPETEMAEPSAPSPPLPSRPHVDPIPPDTETPTQEWSLDPDPTPPEPVPPLDAAQPHVPPEPRGGGFREGPPPSFRNRGRGGGFREPPRYGAVPRPVPGGQADGARGQQRGWQPPRPPAPRAPVGQPPYAGGPQWRAHPGGPGGRAATPPPPTDWSYADHIRVDDLVPPRRIPPARGWRRLVHRATFGLVNPGLSADELRQAELEATIKGVLRGNYKIGVMGKGGVGKTTVSASLGSVLAELRQDDRVVAIDADTAFGKLGSRIDPKAVSSYWELAADRNLETFADVRGRLGNNSAGLFVLAGESSPARRRVLDPAIYREAASRLDRYFTISVIDCSSTMDAPVTQEVLRDLDALVVVSSPWVDGAAVAGQTLDWLANHGFTGLLQRTVVVLNDSDGHADKRTRSVLAQQFTGHGQVVIEVPFDGHLRPGGVLDSTGDMSPPTRRRFVEIAATIAEHFPR